MSRLSISGFVAGLLCLGAWTYCADSGAAAGGVDVVCDEDAAQVRGSACCFPFGYWNPPYYSDCGGPTKNCASKCANAPVHFWGLNLAESWSSVPCLECGENCGSYRVSNGCG